MHPFSQHRSSNDAGFPRRAPRWSSPLLEDANVTWRWPDDGKVRTRKLLSRAAMRPIYRLPSVKLGRDVQLESQLEHHVALLLDACPAVDTFAEQPAELTLATVGGTCRHFPDFAVVLSGKPGFIEVKYRKDVDAGVQARTQYLTQALTRVGIGYRLVTECDLPCLVRQDNARVLLRRGRRPDDEIDALLLQECVRRADAPCLGDLGWDLPDRSAALARHILERTLHVDLSRPLTAQSRVTLDAHPEGWLWA